MLLARWWLFVADAAQIANTEDDGKQAQQHQHAGNVIGVTAGRWTGFAV
jgi:hypothetical protein